MNPAWLPALPPIRLRMTAAPPANGRRIKSAQRAIRRGVTLVELLVGVAVGLIATAALLALFVRSSTARAEVEQAAQQIESGRLALELLREDVHHAGYFGGLAGGVRGSAPACVPRAGVTVSAAALGWQESPVRAPYALHGYAAGDVPATETCVSNAQPGTDVLIVRGTDPAEVAPATAGSASHAEDYYVQVSRCADPAIDPPDRALAAGPGGSGAATRFPLHRKDCATPAPLHRLTVRAYYAGRCSVCSGAADRIPSLRMVELAGATATGSAVIEGIEALRIEYLLDLDGDGRVDAVRRCKAGMDPCGDTEWASVVGVRVHLLARTPLPIAGYRDDKTYDMGLAGVIPAPRDGYRRHQFSAQIAAFNLAGPREP